MLAVFFSIILGSYLLLLLWFWLGWERLPVFTTDSDNKPEVVTVIIPIRNEAQNILQLLKDLEQQTFDTSRFQVIVVDDNSSDDSLSTVQNYQQNSSLNLSLIALASSCGKKEALAAGIEQSKADFIFTTDGDCRVPSEWLEVMVNCFKDQIKMVVGPVEISPVDNFFGGMQMLEFTSLIGSGAATLGWHKPTMCNGANLAFRTEIFHEVEGYQDNLEQDSGDDIFLMHKINQEFPDSIHFCKDQGAIVQTAPVKSFKKFLSQRQRWAGKWGNYKDRFTRILAVYIYLVQLSIMLLIALAFIDKIPIVWLVNLMVAKAIFEYLFLKQVAAFFRKRINGIVFLTLQFIYPVYVVLVGLMGLFGKGEWKNRKVK